MQVASNRSRPPLFIKQSSLRPSSTFAQVDNAGQKIISPPHRSPLLVRGVAKVELREAIQGCVTIIMNSLDCFVTPLRFVRS
jgi:hypothetical protein